MFFRIALAFTLCRTGFAAELPVRQVVLYKHGVGFFERAGALKAGESARLDFKAAEMNDVLKSLTVTESGTGKISGLRYDSSIPLGQKLESYPFRIENGQPLSAVLDQLKGARVEMQFGTEKVAGAIVAARLVPGDKDHAEREQITLLLDSGDLRVFDLGAAVAIRFTDAKLQSQFRDYLAALTASRSKEKRSLYIDSTDAKGRDVQVSYIIPTPVWKSSYRLIFDSTPTPTLEGWAIVDNTTGEDWTNVQLALVSGKPISFVSALYEPRYVNRQTAELPEDASVAPTIHGGEVDALAEAPSAGLAVNGGVIGGIIGGVPGGVGGGRPDSKFRSMRLGGAAPMAQNSVVVNAAAREVGELFEYRIPTAVTVKQNESAMLPFLQQKINSRKLVVYSDPNAVNPQNAAELTNTTGKTLDGGPITVYDAGSYAGEALVETVKMGDKRLISYAVDLGTRIATNVDSKGAVVREIHVQRGIMTTRSSYVETKTYTIRNVDAKAKTLIVEHPVRDLHLLSPKPKETASNVYRFEVALPPNSTEKLPVVEENLYNNTTSVSSMTPDILLTYVQNKSLSDAARKQLQQIIDLKNQIAAADSEYRVIEGRINSIVRDQDRIRQNINSLNQVSGQQQQVQTYSRQLAQQETELATLRDRQAALQTQSSSLQAALNSAIEKMDF